MGEHRVSIKATFSMHGFDDKIDWWLNWDDDIPERMQRWTDRCHENAMQKYWAEDAEYQEQKAKEKREAEEARERAEYKRLKQKFG